MATEWFAIIIALVCAFVASFAQLLFKKGSEDMTIKLWQLLKSKNLVIGVIIYIIVTLFGLVAYHYGDLSVIYPLIATSFIWVALLSKKYLNENINIWKWLGIASIIIGIALIGFGAM
ncbi:EamA family transporter [Candidatus Woesearchaeota archaeon]|nr:EamA family transporter [Candidatus Woesearchaeota archaeon]